MITAITMGILLSAMIAGIIGLGVGIPGSGLWLGVSTLAAVHRFAWAMLEWRK